MGLNTAYQIALQLAASGLPCFPCNADKRPSIGEHEPHGRGFHSATTDPAILQVMFARDNAVLVGVPTGPRSGIVVVDVDYRHGGGAWEDFNHDALAASPTRVHRTQHGGRHYVFCDAPGVRNSQAKLAPGIDVRGDGGYIIMPPSEGYAIDDESEPAPCPDWLLELILARPAASERPTFKPNGHAPSRNRIDGYVRWLLDRVRAAADGQKHVVLRNTALLFGGILEQSGYGESEAAELLLGALPMGVADYRLAGRTAEWGLRYGAARPYELPDRPEYELRQRANGRATGADARKDVPPVGEVPSPPLPLVWFRDIEASLEARDFVQGLLIEQTLIVIYGQSNSGKTFWFIDLCLHIAAGWEWCGRRVEQSGIVYCVLEGGGGFRNRVAAWKDAKGVAGYDMPFAAIPSSINLLDPNADTGALIETVRLAATGLSVPVRLIVVDTLARAMAGGNENAPDDMGAMIANADRIRNETGAAVAFVHHSGKDESKGGRGHSSREAAADTEIEVAELEEYRVAAVVKQRELPKCDALRFRLSVFELGTNRHGEAVTTCLVEHEGTTKDKPRAGRKPNGREPSHADRALEILADLCATQGRPGYAGVPLGYLSVPEDWWRERFYERAMPGAEQDTKKHAFARAAKVLIGTHQAGMAGGRVWHAKPEESQY